MTFQQSYELELKLAGTKTCVHGSTVAACGSSMCHVHDPADFADDVDADLTSGEAEAFLQHLVQTYL